MVLFLCVQNAARSQMAEGFFRKYARNIRCMSAGTLPADKVNPNAVTVMKEVGIDISASQPKVVSNEMLQHSTIIINMGCMENNFCPSVLLKDKILEDWDIEDPAGKSIEKVREIRDQIETKVVNLIRQLSGN